VRFWRMGAPMNEPWPLELPEAESRTQYLYFEALAAWCGDDRDRAVRLLEEAVSLGEWRRAGAGERRTRCRVMRRQRRSRRECRLGAGLQGAVEVPRKDLGREA
jgi:hypothetical protein